MSAIYGAIDLKGNSISPTIRKNLFAYYSKFQIDKLNDLSFKNILIGCGIQFFKEEARNESMPYYDENKGILFSADCILDNRLEICEILSLPKNTPDGKVLLESYYKWGMDLYNYVKGIFAFSLYDFSKNQLILSSDHFAGRCLFYHQRDGIIYFSTLLFPLVHELGLNYSENKRWIFDSISLLSPAMLIEPKETAIENIFKLVSGTYVIFDLNTKSPQEVRFYNPKSQYKTDWSITLEQSENMIRETLTKSIADILRGTSNVGSQLSQGLDSSTVACIAARNQSAINKTIHSYTSVPLKEANLPVKGYDVFDETNGVKKIVNAYPNIIPRFIDSKGRSFLLEISEILKIWEEPCKSQQNAIWTDEIMHLSAKDNCKILLTGATGNCTISAGYTDNAFYHYLKHLRLCKAMHSLDLIKNLKISRLKYVKSLVKHWLKFYLWFFNKDARDCYSQTLVNPKNADLFNVKKRLNKEALHFYPLKDMDGMRKEIYMPNAYAQIGEVETKYSLKYGVIQRDPTRTVDVMKMCFSLPIDCYVSSDYDRRLIRVGMSGIVPEEIRHDVMHRGSQGGDNEFRMSLVWDSVLPEMKKTLYSAKGLYYLSQDKLDATFNHLTKSNLSQNISEVTALVNAYSMIKYLELLAIE